MQENLNILYVEDDARSRRVMEMVLVGEMNLSDVTIFEDSADFLDRALNLSSRPDVIFLDIHVEPYTGFDMLQMLRDAAEFEDTKVIALTASVMNEEVQQLREAGFDGCLAKPIDMDTFPALLENILDGKSVWNIVF